MLSVFSGPACNTQSWPKGNFFYLTLLHGMKSIRHNSVYSSSDGLCFQASYTHKHTSLAMAQYAVQLPSVLPRLGAACSLPSVERLASFFGITGTTATSPPAV